MQHYTTPRLVAIVFSESDAVRTSGIAAASEKGYKDIFAAIAATDNGGENE